VPNVPEYHLICASIAIFCDMRIIVLEYNGYKDSHPNKVLQFLPRNQDVSDTVILINFSNHFTLVVPK